MVNSTNSDLQADGEGYCFGEAGVWHPGVQKVVRKQGQENHTAGP